MLRREKLPAPIEVHNQPVTVLMATVEIGDSRVLGWLHAVRSIGRQPPPGRKVDLGPIMHPPAGNRFGLEPALPPRRDAGNPAKGDKHRVLHAAVAAPGGEPFDGK